MAKATQQLDIACNVDVCYDTFQEIAGSIKGFEIKRSDKSQHALEIRTGSWITTPVTINVKMRSIAPEETLLFFEAKTASVLDVSGAIDKAF